MVRFSLTFSFTILSGSSLIFSFCFYSCTGDMHAHSEGASDSTDKPYEYAYLFSEGWFAPDTASLTSNEMDMLVRYGRDLISHTSKYFGPAGKISKEANGMNCQNCHLNAGTQLWANSFSAVYSNYPKVRARSGMLEHLEKRINDCMQRSLNGKKIDSLSREMRAMVAYINWVGKDVPKDSVPEGASVANLRYLDRPADPAKGKAVFEVQCISCHGKDGQGKLNADGTCLYPPLWGEHSFNTAAGMYRISRMASFIKSNMPFQKSTYSKPLLSDEEAWDVAAFINSQPRPEKFFPEDWPDIARKPVDHPFGPFADNFSGHQHKYGPFNEIKMYYQSHSKLTQSKPQSN
jgi:thiosulfate dehydrogenase